MASMFDYLNELASAPAKAAKKTREKVPGLDRVLDVASKVGEKFAEHPGSDLVGLTRAQTFAKTLLPWMQGGRIQPGKTPLDMIKVVNRASNEVLNKVSDIKYTPFGSGASYQSVGIQLPNDPIIRLPGGVPERAAAALVHELEHAWQDLQHPELFTGSLRNLLRMRGRNLSPYLETPAKWVEEGIVKSENLTPWYPVAKSDILVYQNPIIRKQFETQLQEGRSVRAIVRTFLDEAADRIKADTSDWVGWGGKK